ncbi:uncharacterized protein LOC135648983 isoform X3 [Musa acuminata AAA Group]|uniref:uncharacterized protein LOC135648983 isoform X3 n=1 Tax=Musa acuminata AAA Group TaxID=214697 RepID=UPI0031DD00C8
MELIEAVLDSMVLNCSKEVVEQAQAINKSCSIQDGDKTIPADATYQPLGRRPALGRKRAMFRLKPLSGNPVPDFDLNSQLDHIDDPEEYYFAFEQLENADKELKKLRGEVATEAAKNQRATGRRRRPGILGKTVSYKPHVSAIDTIKAFNASKEDSDGRNAISYKVSTRTKSNENLHPDSFDQPYNLYLTETNNGLFVGIEQEDSVADEENDVNNILEKLFSFEALDEGEGTALLTESLQIKSMEDNHIQLDPSCEHPDHEAEDPAPSCTNHKNRKGLVTAEDHVISQSITNVNEGGADENMQNQVKVLAPDVLVVGPEASRENSIPWTTVLPPSEQSKDEHIITGADTETRGHNASSATSQNNGKKQKALPSRKNKRKLVSRRQSLADAGMMWKSGVRRSTRIKSRPLQYWRGERFLYGRIHDSLTTVIGLKYTGEDGKDAELKVKSFVSEEYSHLVAQAALH